LAYVELMAKDKVALFIGQHVVLALSSSSGSGKSNGTYELELIK